MYLNVGKMAIISKLKGCMREILEYDVIGA